MGSIALSALGVPAMLDGNGTALFIGYGTYESHLGATLSRNDAGQLVFADWQDGAAARAGILSDDALLVFDGTPVGPTHSVDDLEHGTAGGRAAAADGSDRQPSGSTGDACTRPTKTPGRWRRCVSRCVR